MREVDKGGVVSITRTTKDCVTCKTTKPIEAFGFHPHTKDGHKRECKDCAGKKVMVQWRRKRGEEEAVDEPTGLDRAITMIEEIRDEVKAEPEPTLQFANPTMGMDPRLIAALREVSTLKLAVASLMTKLDQSDMGRRIAEAEAKDRSACVERLTGEVAEWQKLAESLQRDLDALKTDPTPDPVSQRVSDPLGPIVSGDFGSPKAPNRPNDGDGKKQITKTPAELAASKGVPAGYPDWFAQIPGRFLKQAEVAYNEVRDLLSRNHKRMNDGQLRAAFDGALMLTNRSLPTGPDQPIVFRKLVKVMVDPIGQAEETFHPNHKGNQTGQTFYKARTGYYRMVYHVENGQPKFLKIGHRRDFYEGDVFGGQHK